MTPNKRVSPALTHVIPNIISPTEGMKPTHASALATPKSYTWVEPGALENVREIFWDKILKLSLAKL